MQARHLICGLLGILAIACATRSNPIQAGRAETAAAPSKRQSDTPPSSRAGAQAASTTAQTLEGKVETLQAAAGIKAIGEGLHRLKRTAQEITGELQRQDLVVVSEPDAIGPIIMPAIPDPSGTISAGGYLPPRKKWLDLYMSELQHLIPLVGNDLADTAIPSDKQAAVSGSWQQMQSLIADVQVHFKNLGPLVEGPKFDSDAIGKEALAIYQDAEQMDKLRKQVFHIVKKKD